MRVLVTGGTGFVGSHTAVALNRQGHEVRLLVRTPQKVERVFGPLGAPGLAHVVGDVTERADVERALDGCDAVVHAAAVTSIDPGRAGEIEATNLRAAEHVLGGARERGLDPIVHVSSLSALFPPDGPVFTPDDPVKDSQLPYARSKAECERVARRLQEGGAPVTITYPGGVWGPNDPSRSEGIEVAMRFFRAGVVPAPPGGGFPVVDVRDLAAVHAAALKPGCGPRRYTVGGHLLRVREMFAIFGALTGRRFVAIPVPDALMRGVGRLGDLVQRLTGVGAVLTSEAMETLTAMVPSDDSCTAAELGVVCRDPAETLRDALRWMHADGQLSARHLGHLATG